MTMWQLIKTVFQPLIKRLFELKYLVLTIAVLSIISGFAYILNVNDVFFGVLVTTPIPIMGYVAMVDVVLLIVLYALVSRQSNLPLKLTVYSLIYVLFSISGTGLSWSSALINTVVLVMTPYLVNRFSTYKWAVLAFTTSVLTLTFILSGAPGQSLVMGLIYFIPVVVLISLELKVPERIVHDVLTGVTLVYPAMFIGVLFLLIQPNGDYHYQTVQIDQKSYIIAQASVSFIDQVYELTVYEAVGWGFYQPIYTYSKEWEVGLWTMQDATLQVDDESYTITLVSPDLSQQFSEQFTKE